MAKKQISKKASLKMTSAFVRCTRLVEQDLLDAEEIISSLGELIKRGKERKKSSPEEKERRERQKLWEKIRTEEKKRVVVVQRGMFSGLSCYPEDFRVHPLSVQAGIFGEEFGLYPSGSLDFWEDISLPPGAEGWFAVPYWRSISSSYTEALEKILEALAKKFDGLKNPRSSMVPGWLEPTEETKRAWDTLYEKQQSDILVVSAQLGGTFRASCVKKESFEHTYEYVWERRAYKENEFDLGAFAVGSCLLTHPRRLKNDSHLFLSLAPGDPFLLLPLKIACRGDRFLYENKKGKIEEFRPWFGWVLDFFGNPPPGSTQWHLLSYSLSFATYPSHERIPEKRVSPATAFLV